MERISVTADETARLTPPNNVGTIGSECGKLPDGDMQAADQGYKRRLRDSNPRGASCPNGISNPAP